MPVYPGMPYGYAAAWCFPVFEWGVYILFIICFRHAARRGMKEVMYLAGGLAFGLILEYIEVLSDSYTYGRFMVMFGKAPLHIPLCIGAGWGIIMYTARLFSDSLKLSLWACVALDTLLALNIDLSMDTVAYRLHMWHWNWAGTGLNPLTAQWFGIPWGNFVGWQTVVFCYSAFSRLFEKRLSHNNTHWYTFILVALLALVCSQAVLYTTENYIYPFLYDHFGIDSVHRFLALLVVLFILLFVGWRKRQVPAGKITLAAWLVPGWFHIYFFGCFFICLFYKENCWMTLAACLNFVFAILIHLLPVSFTASQNKKDVTAGNVSLGGG